MEDDIPKGKEKIIKKISDYVPVDKKCCIGECDRQRLGKGLLVCHGCKRILTKPKLK